MKGVIERIVVSTGANNSEASQESSHKSTYVCVSSIGGFSSLAGKTNL